MKALGRIVVVLLLPAITAIASLLFDQPRAEAGIECRYVCFYDQYLGACPNRGSTCIGCYVPPNEPTC